MKKTFAAASLVTFSLLAPRAEAFCGFYVSGADAKLFNNATQVVLMREGTRTVLSMQNNYQGPTGDFAMVVPVPIVLQEENVKTLPRAIFDRIDALTAPRLVEYWEQDPCAAFEEAKGRGGPPGMAPRAAAAPAREKSDLGVTVEAEFAVGEYQIVILSAKDSSGLDTWLRQEKYKIPEGAEAYLRPYVQSGSKFFVAKVDAKKVKFEDGMVTLSPLRFHYDTETFSLPVRLGLMNSKGTQDLIVNVLARAQRYEVANYPNVTIPTNIEVADDVRTRFGGFYTALFDRTMERTPKAVITEYSWDASSCDPCPTPALTPNELTTLGADALPSSQGSPTSPGRESPVVAPPQTRPGGPMNPMPTRLGRRPWGGGGFVLTRLHARYTKDAVGEDLVFRAAPPIAGGREQRQGNGLEKGATPGGMNNFQGRYIIRHPWTGAVACNNPRRGVWGGPPGGALQNKPTSLTNAAFAPRGQVQLTSMVMESVPELGIEKAGGAAQRVATATGSGASPTSPGAEAKGRGCAGCATAPESASLSPWALSALVALAFAKRRSAKRP